jgi:predicted transposase/invertase (TIGR01784 family)
MQKIRFGNDDDIIDICYDAVFKATFTRDSPTSQGALQRLISAFIGREVQILTVIANEPPVQDAGDRRIRYDIRARFNDGELANIEITVSPRTFEKPRLEYHLARLFSAQEIQGSEKDYGDLRRTYQISFIVERRLFRDAAFVHNFVYYDRENEIALDGRTSIIVVELQKIESVAGKPVAAMSAQERWAVFFRYCADAEKRVLVNSILAEEEGISMAAEVLLTISKDEEERARLENRLKSQLDWQSEMSDARREGIAEGEEKGQQKGHFEDARRMKASGYPTEEIQRITGLPVEEIDKL